MRKCVKNLERSLKDKLIGYNNENLIKIYSIK